MMASAAGVSMAAPTPCPARAAISAPATGASPLAREAAVNSASPARNIRRRPNRSAARPPASVSIPVVSRYVVTTHSRSEGSNRSVRPIDGSAMFTTVMSSTTMNCATHSSTSTDHGRRCTGSAPA